MTISDSSKKSFSRHARVRARRTAVQAIYQWQMTDKNIKEVITEFEDERSELRKADKKYFCDILNGMAKHSSDIEKQLGDLIDRELNEIDPVERAILQLGIYELKYQPELPWRVVINESIELAKMFGAEQSHKYINGILDKAAQELRSVEISSVS